MLRRLGLVDLIPAQRHEADRTCSASPVLEILTSRSSGSTSIAVPSRTTGDANGPSPPLFSWSLSAPAPGTVGRYEQPLAQMAGALDHDGALAAPSGRQDAVDRSQAYADG
jgi:hypothetical protein